MPVYEYKCNACGREFEYQQRMSDPEQDRLRGVRQAGARAPDLAHRVPAQGRRLVQGPLLSTKPEAKSSESKPRAERRVATAAVDQLVERPAAPSSSGSGSSGSGSSGAARRGSSSSGSGSSGRAARRAARGGSSGTKAAASAS